MVMSTHDRIYDAVFPPPSDVETPTPAATPVLGSSTFGSSFGSPKISQPPVETGATEQILWDQCWHTATSFLTLADRPFHSQNSEMLMQEWVKPYTNEIHQALKRLVPGMLDGRMHQNLLPRDDLVAWYFENAVLVHYTKHVLQGLIEILKNEEHPHALTDVAQHLEIAQLIYMHPIRTYFPQILPDGKRIVHQLEHRCRYLLKTTLPQDLIVENLDALFRQQATALPNHDALLDQDMQESVQDPRSFSPPLMRQSSLKTIRVMQEVGLGGVQAQQVFAEVMCDVLREHVESDCAGKWSSPSNAEYELRSWVENDYARFIVETLSVLHDNDGRDHSENTIVSLAEVQQWQAMGLNQLGRLRTDELFEVVVEWDNTKGAMDDLRGFVTNPLGRTYLTNTFNAAIAHRLLQPGASTVEILQVYINIIRSFTYLDPKGVLLDRVSRPIRRYLRERDDTVNIVVGGLLADPNAGSDAEESTIDGDTLFELAVEMNKSSIIKDDEAEDADLDFDDMNWNPDPVDAGPEYKSSRKSDVIGSLISLFESKNVFVAEFQKILGERLLKAEYDFDREIRVLELLKIRFGESTLQACEVMLRDILDSRRVDASIQKEAPTTLTSHTGTAPALHARILSHLFWPPLHSETFQVPTAIEALQDAYSRSFENLKASRKLTWLQALGQVTVTLDLEDRTVTEIVQTWQAAVIYAFEAHPDEPAEKAVTRTLSYLVESLEMSESLVLNATTFWIGKLVLKQTSSAPPAYSVLETLSDEAAAQEGTASAAAAQAAETVTAGAAPAMLSEQEVAREKMEVYKQYVVGMLTNGGAMGLAQIVMMLKLTVPGGFPFGNEELKDFLESEVRAGRLDFGGGTYKMVK